MFSLMLTVAMMSVKPVTTQVAQFQPCVWPNKCVQQAPSVAQFQPCVWPNKCAARS